MRKTITFMLGLGLAIGGLFAVAPAAQAAPCGYYETSQWAYHQNCNRGSDVLIKINYADDVVYRCIPL